MDRAFDLTLFHGYNLSMTDIPEQPSTETAALIQYGDEDLVYVDPRRRTVVGMVEWTNTGKPKTKFMEELVEEEDETKDSKDDKKPRRGPRRKRAYPWGTYRTMKKIYKVEGKQRHVQEFKTFDDALKIAVEDAF